jgi:flagellar assembly protein FliH
MKPDSKTPVRIRARDVREVNPWRLPDMSDEEREQLVALAQKKREPEPVEEVQVVEEEVYAEKLTLAQWEAIYEEARQEGIDQGKKEGYEAGYKEGVAKGQEDGLASGTDVVNGHIERLVSILEELKAPLGHQSEELERLVVSMVIELSRSVVQAELSTRPELLHRAVADALACVPPSSETPVLKLNPDDCELLKATAEEQGWDLVPDQSLAAGGCIVQAGSCRVDASVKTRFAQVADQLLSLLQPGSDDQEIEGDERAD